MTKNTKAQPKVPEDLTKWPAAIDLRERLPADHPERPGQLRYGQMGITGEGRIDRMTMRQVPQLLVEAARQKEMQDQDA